MNLRFAALSLCLLAISPLALAEKADRDKPLQIEASRVSIDDGKKIQILEGDVLLTKGTMVLKAERVVITEDRYGFQKGTAFSGKGVMAKFRQKRDGSNEYIEGEAERIEYDTHNEVLELFHRAWVKNGEDQVKGDYIWYDTVSEKYLVTAGEAHDAKGATPRVRAVIQPKNKVVESTPAAQSGRGEKLQLKGAAGLSDMPAEN